MSSSIDTDYTRDSIKLIVEELDESLVITYADLNPVDTYHLVITLVGKLSDMVGRKYNSVLEDLKELEEEEGEK